MATTDKPRRATLLDRFERFGNKLPDPATLFLIGAAIVIVLSQIGASMGWSIQPVKPISIPGETALKLEPTGDPLNAVGLLSADGIYWMFQNLVKNFIEFPPLGIVLVGMLGIGVAERTGMMAALLKAFLYLVPASLLTPAMVFLGVMSSMGIDAGYIVLPPLAMALYKAVGRSPIVGLAAVFAGVSAGFNANLFVTALDPMLASFSNIGAQIIDPSYAVNPAANWFFMIGSTVVMTLAGWFITARFVEPRFERKPEEDGGPPPEKQDMRSVRILEPTEKSGLIAAGITFAIVFGVLLAMILVPNWPLWGQAEGDALPRWARSIVPIIFLSFLLPALAYGAMAKTIRNERDAAKAMVDAMAGMAPIIVLAFFAAQFIAYFNHSNLGTMLAMWGGQALATAQMHWMLLIVVFILVTAVFNLFVGSMSAKYAIFAPIFVPMFMLVGISPELTQAAYRIGDSVTNIITPLNAYLIIILVAMKKYVPKAGMGTLVSTMLPYSIGFLIIWTIMLLVWMATGAPLGPDGPLRYEGIAAG
ncbi:MAG: AbgT family transporter [Fimbriimonadales bacterium]|nr:AbgT family transporter [Fimbriimonadales bacterium]